MIRTKNLVTFVGILFLSSTVLVDAHGYFSSITVDGVAYSEGDCTRPHPSSQYDYPISGLDRPSGLTSNDMTCGWLPAASRAANRKCPVNPGSTVTWQFHYEMGMGNSDNFYIDPSHHGPCLVYMAKSETGSGNVWFKVFHDGYNTSSRTWCVDRMRSNGGKFSFKIPTDITPGNYLIRGELIALHEGDRLNGAQPYVGCAEITVGGSGTSNPSGLVSIPGVYSANDAGIHFDIYDGFKSYPIPGPAVYVSGSASGSTPPSTPVTTSKVTSGKLTTKGSTSSSTSSTSSRTSTSTSSSRATTAKATTAKGTTAKGTTGMKGTTTTSGSTSNAMCYIPGTPNVNGTILSNPPYCGKNARKARCADGQCCSKYGYCGPIPDENGNYYEEVDGEYQKVSYQVAVNLYCNRNQGDYRKVPCNSIHNKDDESVAGAGVSIKFDFLLLLSSIVFIAIWNRIGF